MEISRLDTSGDAKSVYVDGNYAYIADGFSGLKIINVENNGKLQQIEITYMEGYTKVKAHRIIENLVQKGILTKEKLGKMRLIKMNKDFYEILKEQ